MISGIYGIAKDFRYKFPQRQLSLTIALYKSLTEMNLKWLEHNKEEVDK